MDPSRSFYTWQFLFLKQLGWHFFGDPPVCNCNVRKNFFNLLLGASIPSFVSHCQYILQWSWFLLVSLHDDRLDSYIEVHMHSKEEWYKISSASLCSFKMINQKGWVLLMKTTFVIFFHIKNIVFYLLLVHLGKITTLLNFS